MDRAITIVVLDEHRERLRAVCDFLRVVGYQNIIPAVTPDQIPRLVLGETDELLLINDLAVPPEGSSVLAAMRAVRAREPVVRFRVRSATASFTATSYCGFACFIQNGQGAPVRLLATVTVYQKT
ncbi:MAG: hypothetical protein AAB490_01705 [Patescibacteria group bacterium]